jgi:ketosteroid isomerase-like protein
MALRFRVLLLIAILLLAFAAWRTYDADIHSNAQAAASASPTIESARPAAPKNECAGTYMLTRESAEHFAADWIAAWNSHDLARILEHYSEDLEFSSPYIVALVGEPSGKLKGNAAVRDYWSKALARVPNLKFELQAVYMGASTLIVHYRRQDGGTALEWFEFNANGKVCKSAAQYGA